MDATSRPSNATIIPAVATGKILPPPPPKMVGHLSPGRHPRIALVLGSLPRRLSPPCMKGLPLRMNPRNMEKPSRAKLSLTHIPPILGEKENQSLRAAQNEKSKYKKWIFTQNEHSAAPKMNFIKNGLSLKMEIEIHFTLENPPLFSILCTYNLFLIPPLVFIFAESIPSSPVIFEYYHVT